MTTPWAAEGPPAGRALYFYMQWRRVVLSLFKFGFCLAKLQLFVNRYLNSTLVIPRKKKKDIFANWNIILAFPIFKIVIKVI